MDNPRCRGFYYPPHPADHCKIRRVSLNTFERYNRFFTQRKFNGTHIVIHIKYPEVSAWDRRGTPLTLYKVTEEMKACLFDLNINKDKEYVLDGEVLHTKAVNHNLGVQAATNTIVLFDLLFCEKYLAGVRTDERLAMLETLCKSPKGLEEKKRAKLVSVHGESKLWLAETFQDDFLYHFDEFFEFSNKGIDCYPEIEGLILKDKRGELKSGERLEDVEWLVRCRKEKPKMYTF